VRAGTVDRNAEYHLFAPAARFVAPGAVRIGSDSPGALPVAHVAFRNPDRSLVLIAYNNADRPTTVSIATATGGLCVTAPPQSLSTVTWGP
jgi:glucosylceramidase